jgi:hypothetical protein
MLRPILAIATIGFALALNGCAATITPGTPEAKALCDAAIIQYAHERPGSITMKEWEKWRWDQELKIYDKNNDGVISENEWLTAFSPPGSMDAQLRDAFRRFDRGSKGYLNFEDLASKYGREFERHDLNHDGRVSGEECSALIYHPELSNL